MFTFKETNNYNSTIAQFCEEINVGKNLFIQWLRDKNIFDSENDPTLEHHKFFVEYDSPYRNKNRGTSYSINHSGKEFIKSILTKDDIIKMPRNKKASHRHQSNYKLYTEYFPYPNVTLSLD